MMIGLTTRRLAALTVLCTVSCGGADGSGKDGAGATASDVPPVWARGTPAIDGTELVPGVEHQVWVDGLPPNSVVSILSSNEGPGEDEAGLCMDAWATVCSSLLNAEVLGSVVVDDSGRATFTALVPEGDQAGTQWFQGWALDLDTGASAMTRVLLRHIAIPPSDAAVAMVEVTQEAGLLTLNTVGNSHTGGISWADVNGDLLPDLFVSNGSGAQHRLFLNRGDGTFEDISGRIEKPDINLEDAGVKTADFDNDGDVDIFVPVDNGRSMVVEVSQPHEGGPNLFYINDGNANFTEAAEDAGVLDPDGWRTGCAALGDVNKDGLVDIYLGNWAVFSEPFEVQDNRDLLLLNQGASGFLHAQTSVDGYGRDALTARFIDMDWDFYPDLYVGNVAVADEPPLHDPKDVLYRNDQGVLFDSTDEGMGLGMDAWAAMGVAYGDINNDGYFDLYVTDNLDLPQPIGNPLYLGQADGTFTDNVCVAAGVCAGHVSWPTNFLDLDQDGWLDLWVGTSFAASPDLVYINQGDGTFLMHAQEFFRDNQAKGGSFADYDMDGDVDIFVFGDNGNSRLYRNEVRNPKNWMSLHLEGVTTNRDAIGAVVRLTVDGFTQLRQVSGGDSAHSHSELTLHFGLGSFSEGLVEVLWPTGEVTNLGLLPAGRFYLVKEDQGIVPETLEWASAEYDVATGGIRVQATTSYRARSELTVVASAQTMVWQADLKVAEAEWMVGGSPPPSVQIQSSRGNDWVVPVTLP